MVNGKRRTSLAEAFGGEDTPRRGGSSRRPAVVGGIKEAGADTSSPKKEEGNDMVPGGRGGKLLPADSPVNMTFTVTAKERYLWTLALKRRGLSAVGVLRQTMQELLEEDGSNR